MKSHPTTSVVIGDLSDYPIYRQIQEIAHCRSQIKVIDDYIFSIKEDPPGYREERYEVCERRLCEKNDHKLTEISKELKLTEEYINAKYECTERLIHNEFEERVRRSKQRLLAKYEDRKSKQERLFRMEFNRYQRKLDKAHKKLKRNQIAHNNMDGDDGSNTTNPPSGMVSTETICKKDVYQRPTLCPCPRKGDLHGNGKRDDDVTAVGKGSDGKTIESESATRESTESKEENNGGNGKEYSNYDGKDNRSWPHFANEIMQEKWAKVSGILDSDMEQDVNRMVADQNKTMEVKDILSMFPQCDVRYKSDKNVLQIGTNHTVDGERGKDKDSGACINLKVGSYIACRYKGQSVMFGEVKSITNKDLWCNLRQKGDKMAQHTLTNIEVQHIEDGSVKIKLIH